MQSLLQVVLRVRVRKWFHDIETPKSTSGSGAERRSLHPEAVSSCTEYPEHVAVSIAYIDCTCFAGVGRKANGGEDSSGTSNYWSSQAAAVEGRSPMEARDRRSPGTR